MSSYQDSVSSIQEAKSWLQAHLHIQGAYWAYSEGAYELYA